jgi:hypothetical protein
MTNLIAKTSAILLLATLAPSAASGSAAPPLAGWRGGALFDRAERA